jgi:hypothetical protein
MELIDKLVPPTARYYLLYSFFLSVRILSIVVFSSKSDFFFFFFTAGVNQNLPKTYQNGFFKFDAVVFSVNFSNPEFNSPSPPNFLLACYKCDHQLLTLQVIRKISAVKSIYTINTFSQWQDFHIFHMWPSRLFFGTFTTKLIKHAKDTQHSSRNNIFFSFIEPQKVLSYSPLKKNTSWMYDLGSKISLVTSNHSKLLSHLHTYNVKP